MNCQRNFTKRNEKLLELSNYLLRELFDKKASFPSFKINLETSQRKKRLCDN